MATFGRMYGKTRAYLLNANLNFGSDTFKIGLLTSSYTPAPDTDDVWSTISGNEVSGTGYTAGGVALASVAVSIVLAASWGANWTASTAYNLGQLVIPTSSNGYLYRCSQAGTTGSTAPTWPTVTGETVTDSGVIWTCVGTSVTKVTATNPSWSTATITARYAAIYDSTASNKLVCYYDLGGNITSTAGTFQITFDSNAGFLDLTCF